MPTMSYLDVVATLAAGSSIRYADLDHATKQHVRSLTAERFAEAHGGNGRRVLLSQPSAHVRLTAAGKSYAAALQAAGLILQPLSAPPAPQPKAEKVGRHAKPAAQATVKKSSRKAGAVVTKKATPKPAAPRQILAPQDLEALRRIAAMLPSIDNFTDQFHK